MKTVPGKISRAGKRGRVPIVKPEPAKKEPVESPPQITVRVPRGRRGPRKKPHE